MNTEYRKPTCIMIAASVLLGVIASVHAAEGASGTSEDRVYIKGTDFYLGDKPFRIWALNAGRGMHLTDEQYQANADRLEFLGVNLLRLHSIVSMHYPGKDGKGAGLFPYYRGAKTSRTLENIPAFWKLLDSLWEKHIYVAITLDHARIVKPGDSDILATTPEDKAQWEEAIRAFGSQRNRPLVVFDERCEALRKEFATQLLNLKHPRTGVALKDNPQLALLETVNEHSSLQFYEKGWKFPPYFQNKLRRKWNEYLRDRYPTRAALENAWAEKSKKGLLAEEDPEKDTVALHPIAKNTEEYSDARREDFLNFLISLDINHQKRMLKLVRSLGYKGPTIFSDIFSLLHGRDLALLNSGVYPYMEDHRYVRPHDVFRETSIEVTIPKLAGKRHPYDYGRPFWRSETRNSDGQLRRLHATRIAYPLYNAVYFSLFGGDGVAFHGWNMGYNWKYDSIEIPEKLGANNLNGDIPWQMVFRAAGRLFHSGEITPLKDDDPRLKRLPKNADIKTPQIFRDHSKGLLTVETLTFTAVGTDRPGKFTFRDMEMNFTSDRCNVVIVEKLSEKEYEVTAVGLAGDSMDKETRLIHWDPITYVQGTLAFPGREVESVTHLDEAGREIRTLKHCTGSGMKFADQVRLYRVCFR